MTTTGLITFISLVIATALTIFAWVYGGTKSYSQLSYEQRDYYGNIIVGIVVFSLSIALIASTTGVVLHVMGR